MVLRANSRCGWVFLQQNIFHTVINTFIIVFTMRIDLTIISQFKPVSKLSRGGGLGSLLGRRRKSQHVWPVSTFSFIMTSSSNLSPPISILHQLFWRRNANSLDVTSSSGVPPSSPALKAPQRGCSQAIFVCDHSFYSPGLFVWESGIIERRN